jgi:hypothetical protein
MMKLAKEHGMSDELVQERMKFASMNFPGAMVDKEIEPMFGMTKEQTEQFLTMHFTKIVTTCLEHPEVMGAAMSATARRQQKNN